MRTLIAAAVSLLAVPAVAQDAPRRHAGFERLKELAGTWETDKGGMQATVVYRLTAGGSALHETISPGTDHEMVTIYTLDGDDLILTHYCVMGNQPRMKAEKSDKADVIKFACTTGGGNMKCEADGHMHAAVFTFKDKDSLVSEWTMRKGGKDAGSYTFELRRKK